MSTIQETWKPIPDYPRYEVSDMGQVRSLFWKNSFWIKPRIKILKTANLCGYRSVHLSNDKGGKTWLVHRLVCLAFIGPCPSGMQCAHGNGVRTDNRLENLRWATLSDNQNDRLLHGTASIGYMNSQSVLCPDHVIEIRRLYKSGYTKDRLSKEYGVAPNTIFKLLKGETWKWVKDTEEAA